MVASNTPVFIIQSGVALSLSSSQGSRTQSISGKSFFMLSFVKHRFAQENLAGSVQGPRDRIAEILHDGLSRPVHIVLNEFKIEAIDTPVHPWKSAPLIVDLHEEWVTSCLD